VIVVDTSALVAILRDEPDAEGFARVLRDAHRPRLSAANLAELLIVLAGRTGRDNLPKVERFLARAGVEVEPVDAAQVVRVNEAFLRFGKGRHRACLNYGDCFAYALAVSLDMPLLYKGDDFAQTDVRPAL
jgi:ribonuclease VapC